jgi:hypothetical protein
MMGEQAVLQESLFYGFNLDRHVRWITCCARPGGVRHHDLF